MVKYKIAQFCTSEEATINVKNEMIKDDISDKKKVNGIAGTN